MSNSIGKRNRSEEARESGEASNQREANKRIRMNETDYEKVIGFGNGTFKDGLHNILGIVLVAYGLINYRTS